MIDDFKADLKGVTFSSQGSNLIGGFYLGAGHGKRPTAILIHGLPGIEKNLDIAYRLRDMGWNCLYFHFRGCWGSGGNYSLGGLKDDVEAAVNWTLEQPEVDKNNIALIAGSTGSHPALLYAAANKNISAIVGISPVIIPEAFKFPADMAQFFATMLQGITAQEMIIQWEQLEPLKAAIKKIAPMPVLIVAAGQDDIFPLSDYESKIKDYTNIEYILNEETDHGFSDCRTWLVDLITNWLNDKVNTKTNLLK